MEDQVVASYHQEEGEDDFQFQDVELLQSHGIVSTPIVMQCIRN